METKQNPTPQSGQPNQEVRGVPNEIWERNGSVVIPRELWARVLHALDVACKVKMAVAGRMGEGTGWGVYWVPASGPDHANALAEFPSACRELLAECIISTREIRRCGACGEPLGSECERCGAARHYCGSVWTAKHELVSSPGYNSPACMGARDRAAMGGGAACARRETCPLGEAAVCDTRSACYQTKGGAA